MTIQTRYNMLMLLNRLIFVTVFFFSNIAIHANEIELTRMVSDIEKKQSTPELKQHAIRMGQERAVLCNQCHGEDGNSKKPNIPNLAGQNPVYLLDQIEKFADKRRKNYVMNALSKNFSQDDKENLAIFYANMKVNPIKVNVKLAEKGQPLYIKQCYACHGEKGEGKSDYARLAGQQPQYVEMTLRGFRDKLKNNSKQVKRSNTTMESISKALSNEDIKALAAYVTQLK